MNFLGISCAGCGDANSLQIETRPWVDIGRRGLRYSWDEYSLLGDDAVRCCNCGDETRLGTLDPDFDEDDDLDA